MKITIERFNKEIKDLKQHLKEWKQKGIIGDLSQEGLLDYKGVIKNIDEFHKIIINFEKSTQKIGNSEEGK